MGFSWAMNSVASWKDHELQHHENPSLEFMAFSMRLKGHEKEPKIFMVFSWVFHGFALNLRVFMAHENWKIKGFLMAFLMFFFFMLFPGWHAMKNLIRFPMKIPLKSFENPVNLPWINSQDFHGFLVHSVYYSELSRMRFTKTKLGIVKTLVFFKNNFERL